MIESLVCGSSPPGYTPRLSFYCEFSFTLSYFLGDIVFESSTNCLVGREGSEGFLIFGVFFDPLVPCAYDFYLRASLGEHSVWLSLDGPLCILRIGGVIYSFPCSLHCSATCTLGTI